MATAAELSENSHQAFETQKPLCIGVEGGLSRNMRWGCGHIYDETPVEIAVYVRNDPINRVDPDGNFAPPLPDDDEPPAPFFDPFIDPLSLLNPNASSQQMVNPGEAAVLGMAEAAMQQDYADIIQGYLNTYYPSINYLDLVTVTSSSYKAINLLNSNGNCTNFVNGLLNSINATTGQSYTINSIISTANNSYYYYGSSQIEVDNNGQIMTIAAVFASDPNMMAITNLPFEGHPAIFLSNTFFSNPGQQPEDLIHEWVHGLSTQGAFTDQFLAGLLGWNSQMNKSASQYLSDQFFTNCGQ
jgi:hypothetical protein